MFKRGLAMSLVLGVASVAYAGAVVELVATSANPLNPAGTFDPDEIVTVEVHLRHSADDADRLLRHIQFNLEDTHPDLLAGLSLPLTHDLATPAVSFWDFSSTTACTGDAAQCGTGHWVDDDRASGPTGIAITYYSEVDPPVVPDTTGPNTAAQLMLPGVAAASVRVGVLQIQMPVAAGSYTLDVMNSDAPSAETAARISYGFDASNASWADLTPVTVWGAGTPDLTGGTFTMTVAPSAGVAKWESIALHGAVGEIGLEITADGAFTEPRRDGISKVVVSFSGPISAATAISGNIIVNGCFPDATAVDLSATVITPTLAAADTQMVIEFSPKLPGSEPSPAGRTPAKYNITLAGIQTAGGAAVAGNADRDFKVVIADVIGSPGFKGDARLTIADLSPVRSFVAAGFDPIDPTDRRQVRADVNGDGRMTIADISITRAMIAAALDARSIPCP